VSLVRSAETQLTLAEEDAAAARDLAELAAMARAGKLGGVEPERLAVLMEACLRLSSAAMDCATALNKALLSNMKKRVRKDTNV
jgi:hypothetical protein